MLDRPMSLLQEEQLGLRAEKRGIPWSQIQPAHKPRIVHAHASMRVEREN